MRTTNSDIAQRYSLRHLRPARSIPLVGLLLVLTGVLGVTACSDDDNTPDQPRDASSDGTIDADPDQPAVVPTEDMREALADAMPQYDSSILDAPTPNNWADNLTYNWVFSAMGDVIVDYENADLPPDGAERVGNDQKVVRLDPERGRVKYLSRARAWSPDGAPQTLPISQTDALSRIRSMMNSLEMPTDQSNDGQANTEMVGAGEGAGEMSATFETYHLVRMPRIVNDVPVLNSGIQAAVTTDDNEPVIQRALIKWPALELVPELSLISRQEVIDRALEDVMARQPYDGSEQNVQARLVYAPAEEPTSAKQIVFLPAVQIAVNTLPTPYLITVPIAGQ